MLRTRTITTLGAVMALAVPAAAGAQQDLRSPDAVDAARAPQVVNQQDRRSPDAIDAARPSTAPVQIVTSPVSQPAPSASDGFEWGDAGIGAVGMLGIVGLIGGVALLAVRHRHGQGRLVTPSH